VRYGSAQTFNSSGHTNDHAAVSKCIDRVYSKYIDRLGKKPAPMLTDYSRLIDQQIVYVIGGEPELHVVMVLFREVITCT
jgi:hypothetical protein